MLECKCCGGDANEDTKYKVIKGLGIVCLYCAYYCQDGIHQQTPTLQPWALLG